jgi:CDP-glucose 4,6-dehydratase
MDAIVPSNQWNVGPVSGSPSISVTEFASRYLLDRNTSAKVVSATSTYLETEFLQLDTRKIQNELFWKPKWDMETAIQKTAEWYNSVDDGLQPRDIIKHQILSYHIETSQQSR